MLGEGNVQSLGSFQKRHFFPRKRFHQRQFFCDQVLKQRLGRSTMGGSHLDKDRLVIHSSYPLCDLSQMSIQQRWTWVFQNPFISSSSHWPRWVNLSLVFTGTCPFNDTLACDCWGHQSPNIYPNISNILLYLPSSITDMLHHCLFLSIKKLHEIL